MRRDLNRMLGLAAGAALALSAVPVDAMAQESDEREARRPMTISVAGGTGAYLGVRIADVDADLVGEAGLPGEFGVHVTSVVEEGPAAEAGLQDGDVIVRWNGERLESVAQLQRLMAETPPGRSVALGVIRDGSQREVSVELGDRRGSFGDARVFTVPRERVGISRADRESLRESMAEMSSRLREGLRSAEGRGGQFSVFMGRPRMGVSIQNLGDQLADYFGVEGGALITSVTEDSPAEAAGLAAGDVIVAIEGEAVDGPGELLQALSELDAGPAEVTVVRDGARRTFTVELEEGGNRWQGEDGGVFYFDRDGDGSGIRLFGREGERVRIDPISFEGVTVEPMRFEGVTIEPMDFQLDVSHDGEPIEISIPAIDVPAFEIPAIDMPVMEFPGFDFRIPRVEIVI